MLRESESEYRQRAQAEFDKKIDAYLIERRESREDMEDQGGKMYKSAVDYPKEMHFDLLARFQTGDQSLTHIVKAHRHHFRSLRKWIGAAAIEVAGPDALRWWLRTYPGGRPKNSTP